MEKKAVVVTLEGETGKIVYNSGLNYFYHQEAMEKFIKLIRKGNPKLKITEVHINEAHPPIGEGPGYWCPHCRTWDYWTQDNILGVMRCSYCGLSDNDFYVKAYNNLWKSPMNKKKPKKRRKK